MTLTLPHLPYYARVPTDRRENLRWRLAVCRRAMVDAEFRDGIRQMCADDPLFFINGFCLLVEPREEEGETKKSKILPFILWPPQIEGAKKIVACWAKRDVLILKSRAQGASWLVLMLMLHAWLFDQLFQGALISKDKDSVDEEGNLKALMPKMDWQLTRLPTWLKPEAKKVKRVDGTLLNRENDAIVSGFAATGDAASGARASVFGMDEMAKFPRGSDYEVMDSTQYVANCRIFISTPKGNIGAFYDKAQDDSIVKVVLDWKDNPTANRGLYDVKDGEIVAVDPLNPIDPAYLAELPLIHRRLEDRGFEVDGSRRSKWYNDQCFRSTPTGIAQELDMSFGKSEEKAFEHSTIKALIERHARPALQVGRIRVSDSIEATFVGQKEGPVKVWCPFAERPPRRNYGAGADICYGTGGATSSNSVLIVGDLNTGEQVLEYVSSAIRPPEFARLCVAICKWFWNATLNWDASGGPGTIFGQEVLERLQYWQIIYSHADQMGPSRTSGQKPGTHRHDDESKNTYLTECIEDSLADRVQFRSEATLKEFGEFGFKGGKLIHLRAERTLAESGKGKSHGDRAIAAAMFNRVRRELAGNLDAVPERPPGPDDPLREVPWSCMGNRQLAHERKNRSKLKWF